MKNPAEVKKVMTDAAQAGTAAVQEGVAQARATFQEGATQARAALQTGVEHANRTAADLLKASEDAAEFGRGNMEAIGRASQLYVTGMQDLSRQTLAMFQALSDHTLEGMKTLGTVKSLKEAAEVQANFTRTAFERAMNDTVKLQEAAFKVAEQSFAPLSARMTLAMEKASKPLAA